MGTHVRRVQTVLTEEEYDELIRLSEETHKPVSVLIREAVTTVYLEQAARERRQDALKRLLSLQAPVADWPQMEQEIAQGATET